MKNTNNKKKTIIINSNINNDFIIIKNLKDFKIDFNLYNIKVTDFCISKTIALKIVSDLEMDLIQISFNKKFSICIIDNLSNFLYNQKKKQKLKDKKQLRNNRNKTIRLFTTIANNDLVRKINKIISFLSDNITVTVTVLKRYSRAKKYINIENIEIFNNIKTSIENLLFKFVQFMDKNKNINFSPSAEQIKNNVFFKYLDKFKINYKSLKIDFIISKNKKNCIINIKNLI